MTDYTKKKKLLEELVKARNAVRRKYNLIKFNKDHTEQVLSETFKPITEPLQKLVKNYGKKLNVNLSEDSKSSIDSTNPNFTLSNEIDTTEQQEINTIEKQPDNELPNLSGISEFNKTLTSDDKDVEIPFQDRDKIYGPRWVEDHWELGSVRIRFQENSIIVHNKSFPRTIGLYELIIHKNPINYSLPELNKYKEILKISNAHKKNYKPDSEIKKHPTSVKYNSIIAVLFNSSPKTVRTPPANKKTSHKNLTSTPNKVGGGIIPRYKVARRNKQNIDYQYWDDPNELVDRLRLLVAEKYAGNTNHDNEIYSIIEELREAGYIY